jgi:hypothetical protein
LSADREKQVEIKVKVQGKEGRGDLETRER